MGNEGKEGRETEKFDFFGKVELLDVVLVLQRDFAKGDEIC